VVLPSILEKKKFMESRVVSLAVLGDTHRIKALSSLLLLHSRGISTKKKRGITPSARIIRRVLSPKPITGTRFAPDKV